jgi:hypothetical protein
MDEISSTQLLKLHDPFPPEDIEWRVQQAGEKNGRVWARVLAYVTNRAIMQRLDDVVGPSRWKNFYDKGPDGGILCGIAIYVSETLEWVTKWDGASNTDVEEVKGGLSNSMKRAGVQWGIGRYLYNLEADFAEVTEDGRFKNKTKDGTWFNWNPPKLPPWALPPGTSPEILDEIKTLGATVIDEAEFTLRRKKHNIKEYLRENWKLIQAQPAFATEVLSALHKSH